MKINESQLREIIKTSLLEAVKEGTPWETDGKYRYQGTGSKESKDRVSKIRSKANADNPRYKYGTPAARGDNYDKALNDKNNNWRRKYEVGRSHEDYLKRDKDTEISILYNLKYNLCNVIEDFWTENEDVQFTPQAKEAISQIESMIEGLDKLSKRSWAGVNRN